MRLLVFQLFGQVLVLIARSFLRAQDIVAGSFNLLVPVDVILCRLTEAVLPKFAAPPPAWSSQKHGTATVAMLHFFQLQLDCEQPLCSALQAQRFLNGGWSATHLSSPVLAAVP